LHNKKQGKGCLEIPFSRAHNVWELSALGMPRDTIDLHLKEKLKQYKGSPVHATNQPKPDYTGRDIFVREREVAPS
jgi:hypothetical protein